MSQKRTSRSGEESNPRSRIPKEQTGEGQLAAHDLVQRAQIDPAALTPADVLRLQRAIGNRATGRLMAQQLAAQAQVQESRSAAEGARERAAEQVVRRLSSPPLSPQTEEEGEPKPGSGLQDSYSRTSVPPALTQRTFVAPPVQQAAPATTVQRTPPWSEGLTEEQKQENAARIQAMRNILRLLAQREYHAARSQALGAGGLADVDPNPKYRKIRGLTDVHNYKNQARTLATNDGLEEDPKANQAAVLAETVYNDTAGFNKRGTYAKNYFERIVHYLAVDSVSDTVATTNRETNRQTIQWLQHRIGLLAAGNYWMAQQSLGDRVLNDAMPAAANVTATGLAPLKTYATEVQDIAGNHALDDEEKADQAKLKARELYSPPLNAYWNNTSNTARSLLELIAKVLIKDSLDMFVVMESKPREQLEIAKREHQRDRDRLTEYVNQGALEEGNPKLVNTCEWLLGGRTKLYALTEAGDSDARTSQVYLGEYRKWQALFPEGMGGPGELFTGTAAAAWYDHTTTGAADPQITIKARGTGGWRHEDGSIAIVQPSKKTKEHVWQTLIHEVQHDADKHTMDPLQRYKSEYRAYSGQGGAPYDNLSNDMSEEALVTHSLGGSDAYKWTAKQWAIVKHMYDAPTYTYLNEQWDTSEEFRLAVVAYKDPDSEGFNRDNSIRVDDFYRALHEIPADTETWDGESVDDPVTKLIAAGFGVGAHPLRKVDAVYILNESPAMLGKINTHLKGAAREEIMRLLTQKADE